MRMIRAMLLGSVALTAAALGAAAEELEPLDVTKLSPDAPIKHGYISMSRGAIPETPGLPLTPREKAAYGDTANIIIIEPSADGTGGGTISWSGYVSTGVTYRNTNVDKNIRTK